MVVEDVERVSSGSPEGGPDPLDLVESLWRVRLRLARKRMRRNWSLFGTPSPARGMKAAMLGATKGTIKLRDRIIDEKTIESFLAEKETN